MNKNTIRKLFLAIGIAIVFNLFTNYGIATFYEAPQYDDFCSEGRFGPRQFGTEASCEKFVASADLQTSCAEQKGYIDYEYDAEGCAIAASCNTCNKEYQDAREPYDANVFIILTVLGVAALIAGVILKTESVGSGFLMGGVLSILIATLRNWSNFGDIIRFLILGAVLALLVYIGIKKLK